MLVDIIVCSVVSALSLALVVGGILYMRLSKRECTCSDKRKCTCGDGAFMGVGMSLFTLVVALFMLVRSLITF